MKKFLVLLSSAIVAVCLTACTETVYVYETAAANNEGSNYNGNYNNNTYYDNGGYNNNNNDNNYYVNNEPVNREKNFIDELEPYAKEHNAWRVPTDKGYSRDICGTTYYNFIELTTSYDGCFDNSLYYNLGGKYTVLTFKAYSDGNDIINIYDQNDSLIHSTKLEGKHLPVEISVDLTGVQGMKLVGKRSSGMSPGGLYVFDAIIK